MNKEITFDKLPETVTYLTEQVTAIKEMVSALHPPVPEEKSLIGIDDACVIIQKRLLRNAPLKVSCIFLGVFLRV